MAANGVRGAARAKVETSGSRSGSCSLFLGGRDVGPWEALSKRNDDSDSWVCRVIWVYKSFSRYVIRWK